jgi:hypothetical protein
MVRSIVCGILWLCCTPAGAAVSCDQLGTIALATEQFRSQGESLPAILAEADKLEASNGFSKADMASIRQTVQLTFERTHTALEIRQDCRDPPAK